MADTAAADEEEAEVEAAEAGNSANCQNTAAARTLDWVAGRRFGVYCNQAPIHTSTVMESRATVQKKREREFLASYEENADALFRHCYARVRDRDLAKDIVQEAFTRTWAYIAKGNKVDHLRAFLYRTLHNAIVDTMRKKRSVSLDVMNEEEGFEPESEPSELPAEIREEIKEAVRLLSSLDEMYSTVITMRYINELTPSEIAKALDVSENVISVRIHRGVKQLRELWRERHV